jgi:hypothetical protein
MGNLILIILHNPGNQYTNELSKALAVQYIKKEAGRHPWRPAIYHNSIVTPELWHYNNTKN